MSLQLHRPTPRGLEPHTGDQSAWRTRLRSRRWAPAPLENPEMEPTSPIGAVVLFGGLATLTLVLLLLGYGTGFWG